MDTAEKELQTKLFTSQDPAYKDFHTKLIPTVDPDTTIGVRTPALRKLAKELSGTLEADAFFKPCPIVITTKAIKWEYPAGYPAFRCGDSGENP